MRVKVLFFGVLRDIMGRSGEEIDVVGGTTLGSIFNRYCLDYPRLEAFSEGIVLARNHEFCPRSTEASEGDEIAFLPPVSGGTGSPFSHAISDDPAGCLFALTRQPIDAAALGRRILRGEDGALVNFEGVVRNNTKGRQTLFLDYECYEPMAVKIMAKIGRDIARMYPIGRVSLVHRLGRLGIGETSVAVLVVAPHRKPAFEAALEGINRLKKVVPIWKKEHFADGEVWVDGEWDDSLLIR